MVSIEYEPWNFNLEWTLPPNMASALKVGSKISICPGKSHTENCTNDEFVTSSLTILLVDSKNKVSVGDILWKTTL